MERDYLEEYNTNVDKYKLKALEEYRDYMSSKGEKISLSRIQSILRNAMQSNICKYMAIVRKNQDGHKKGIFKAFDKKSKLIDSYNRQIDEIKSALSVDFARNPYVNGDLRRTYSKVFEKEDYAVYSLFEEIMPYYKNNYERFDEDRQIIYELLSDFKRSYNKERNAVVGSEEAYVNNALEIILREVDNEFYDIKGLPSMNLLVSEIRRCMSKPNTKSVAYVEKLKETHTPKFDGGFEKFTEAKSLGILDFYLEYIGSQRSEKLTSGYNMKAIRRYLNLKKQAETLLKVLEPLQEVLMTRNNEVVDYESQNIVMYGESIEALFELIEHTKHIIKRYANRLKELKYDEFNLRLIDEKNNAGNKHILAAIEKKEAELKAKGITKKPTTVVRPEPKPIVEEKPVQVVQKPVEVQRPVQVVQKPVEKPVEEVPPKPVQVPKVEERPQIRVETKPLEKEAQTPKVVARPAEPIVVDHPRKSLAEIKEEKPMQKVLKKTDEHRVLCKIEPRNKNKVEIPEIDVPNMKPITEVTKKEVASSRKSLKQTNDRLIKERNLSDELLDLSTEDLYRFGFISKTNFNDLNDTEVSMVIKHCNRLRSIISLNDSARTQIRASWPRMEKGKLVRTKEVNAGDYVVQMKLDEISSFNEKLDEVIRKGRSR